MTATVGQTTASVAVALTRTDRSVLGNSDPETGLSDWHEIVSATWSTDGWAGKPGRIGHVYLTLDNGQRFLMTLTEALPE